MTSAAVPDGAWTVLGAIALPGAPALSYQEIVSVTDVPYSTLSRFVTLLVDYEWATIDRHGRFYRVTVTEAGVDANATRSSAPTTKAVVAAARQICRAEALHASGDPYYRPFAPSDGWARKLSQQHGPERAIELLQARQAERRHAHSEQEAVSEAAEQRWSVRVRQADAELRAERERLTPGQRLDRALAALQCAPAIPAARLDTEPVTDGGGGKDDSNGVPRLHDDQLGWAQRRVQSCVEAVERAVDGQQRRQASAA